MKTLDFLTRFYKGEDLPQEITRFDGVTEEQMIRVNRAQVETGKQIAKALSKYL